MLAGGLLCAVACGYRMGGGAGEEFLVVRTVAVPLFQNRSYEPLAEDVFTRSFREGVRSLPCVALTSSQEAEALLRGTVLSVESFPVGVDESFLVLEYGLRAVVSVSLESRGGGEVLWEGGYIEEEIRFYAGRSGPDPSDPMLLQENRREALVRLSQRMSQRAMDRLLLGH